MNTNDIKELLINNKEAYFIESNNQVFYIKPYYLFNPELKGETGAQYRHSYSESNGEAVGKGFWLNGGWDNSGLWELNFDFKHDNIQYTGILFVGKMEWATDYPAGLTTWEGSWPNGEKYANYNSGRVGYFDIKVTKIDDTHVRLQSKQLNRDTIVELTWLPDYAKVSCGAHHHGSSSAYGPCRIKNVKVVPLLYVPQLTGTETTTRFGYYGNSLSIADGVMSNGCYYLNDGWDNTVDWELEFDWKFSGSSCAAILLPPDVTSRDTRFLQVLADGRIIRKNRDNSTKGISLTSGMSANTWYHVQVKKIGNTLYFEENGKTCKIDDWDILPNYNKICIGVDSWASNASIKNIKVKKLKRKTIEIPLSSSLNYYQITGSTTINSENMYGGSSYLTDPEYLVNMKNNWRITCDVKFSGSMCDVQLVKQGVTSRDTDKVDVQYRQVFARGSASKWFYYDKNCSYNTWYPVSFENKDGTFTIIINGNTITLDSSTWSLIGTDSNMGIGVDTWGNVAYVKNIKIEEL